MVKKTSPKQDKERCKWLAVNKKRRWKKLRDEIKVMQCTRRGGFKC